MVVLIEMMDGVSLFLRDQNSNPADYPASNIRKGLTLACDGMDLSEEGVGFGLPVLKFGHKVIFPGDVHITSAQDGDIIVAGAGYNMNIEERMTVRGRKIKSETFYRMKECLSRLHRECPWLRKALTNTSNFLRYALDIKTVFEETRSIGTVHTVYTIDAGKGIVHVSINTGRVYRNGCTGMMVMNEQGATYFDKYSDSNGISLSEKEIGTWDATSADEASFIDCRDDIKFTLQKVKGAKMLRGREFVKSRLAWSGISYVIPPHVIDFAYSIRIGRACT